MIVTRVASTWFSTRAIAEQILPGAAGTALERPLRNVTVPLKPTSVDIMDPYGIPTTMLRLAAQSLPRGSTIRIISGVDSFDADFPAIASSTGVSVMRDAPPMSMPLHDRFLRVDNHLWSVGTSFNNLGQNFSVILEVRDPVTFGEIASVLDTCLASVPSEVRPRSWSKIIRRWWHRVSS